MTHYPKHVLVVFLAAFEDQPEDVNKVIKGRKGMPTKKKPKPVEKHWTAAGLRKLPAAQRDAILEAAAAKAESEYRHNPELTTFDAFGKDLHGGAQ